MYSTSRTHSRRSRSGGLRVLAAWSIFAAVLVWPSPGHASQAAVTGLDLTSDTAGTIVVTWDVPDQTPTDYRVNWAKSSDSFPSHKAPSGNDYPDTNTITLSNLEPGVEYKVRVRARYKGAQLIGDQRRFKTSWTEAEHITVASVSPPARPRGLTGTTTHDSVTLTWNTSRDSSITSYQILRRQRGVDKVGDFQTLEDNTGSNATTYVDTDVEAGERYVYRIKARNSGGLSGWSNYFNADLPNAPESPTTQAPRSEETLVIFNDDDDNNPATGAPTISGTTRVGETLTADTSAIMDDDGLTSVSYSYQWVRNDGTDDTNIGGATSSTYTLVVADVGNTIKVTVTFDDDEDNAETLTSAATATIRPIWREAPAWPTSRTARGGKSSTDVGGDGIADYELIPRQMADAASFEIQWWDPICWWTLGDDITPYCPDAGDEAAQAAEEQRAKRRFDRGRLNAYLETISYQQPTTDNPAIILTNLPADGMYILRIRGVNEHGDRSNWSEYVYLADRGGSSSRWMTESEVSGG